MRRVFLIVAMLFFSSAQMAIAAEDDIVLETAYFELKPSIVSNLHGGPKYIRMSVQIMTERADRLWEIELHAPALRHIILMTLAEKDGNEIKTPEGKEAFRQELLELLQDAMDERSKVKGLVYDLFFTTYYIK